MDRLLPWALALVVSVVLALVLIPTAFLAPDHLTGAVTEHEWGTYGYEDAFYYLAGIVMLAAAGGLLVGWVLSASQGRARLHATLRYLTQAVSLGGFSPLQAALIYPIATLFVWHVGWVEGSTWLIRLVAILLLGLPLAAELALRFAETPADGLTGRLRVAGAALQEQAPALAGRLLWVALGGVLFLLVISRERFAQADLEQLPAEVELPAELLLAAVLVVLIAFLLWIAGGVIRNRRLDSGLEPETADPEQCNVTQPGRPILVWGLVVIVVLWPVVMSWIAGDTRPLSVQAGQAPGSAMLPWTTDWGSTRQGQDLHAILYHAWRNSVEAGIIAAALSATAGVLWRFGSSHISRSARDVTEASLFRVPPVLLFLSPAGMMIVFGPQALDFRAIGIAVALVLLPQSLRLMRIDCGKVPTTIACQILLGTLLALGWTSLGLQFIGLMSPVEPAFDSVLSGAMSSQAQGGEARWILHRGLVLIIAAITLNLLALGALVRAYNLPRELTRLRG